MQGLGRSWVVEILKGADSDVYKVVADAKNGALGSGGDCTLVCVVTESGSRLSMVHLT